MHPPSVAPSLSVNSAEPVESWPPSHLLLQDREREKMARFGSTRQPAKERGVDRCNVCSHSVC